MYDGRMQPGHREEVRPGLEANGPTGGGRCQIQSLGSSLIQNHGEDLGPCLLNMPKLKRVADVLPTSSQA